MRDPETLTHATTQPQPMAWALASGHCPVINSDTRPDMRHIGTLIGIHAGVRMPSVADRMRIGPLLPSGTYFPLTFDCGALVGVARLVGVVRQLRSGERATLPRGRYGEFGLIHGRSSAVWDDLRAETCDRIRPWWRGPWGWLLEDAWALPEHIPMRGAGGLWRIPFDRAAPEEAGPADWALEQWRKGRAER